MISRLIDSYYARPVLKTQHVLIIKINLKKKWRGWTQNRLFLGLFTHKITLAAAAVIASFSSNILMKRIFVRLFKLYRWHCWKYLKNLYLTMYATMFLWCGRGFKLSGKIKRYDIVILRSKIEILFLNNDYSFQIVLFIPSRNKK